MTTEKIVYVEDKEMQDNCINPDNARDFRGANPQDGAGDRRVLVSENIFVRTLENAPANDDLLHGRARLCRSCGAETQSSDVCPACADALREERATEQAERCRVHRVRYVEDLPVSVLREMQAERGRC